MKSLRLLILFTIQSFFLSAQHSTMFLEDIFDQTWIIEAGITKMTSTRTMKKNNRSNKIPGGNYRFISGIKISEKARSVNHTKTEIREAIGKGGAIKNQYLLDQESGLLKEYIMNDILHKYYFYNEDGTIHYIVVNMVLKKSNPGSHLMTKYQLFEFSRDAEGKLIEKTCYVFKTTVKDIRNDLCSIKNQSSTIRSRWFYSYDERNRLAQVKVEDINPGGKMNTGIYVPKYDANNFPIELHCYTNSPSELNLVGKRFFEYE